MGEGVRNFLKIASKWCILVYFRTVIAKFKTENLYEKICVSLRKDFKLEKINYYFFFQIYSKSHNISHCNTAYISQLYYVPCV